MLIVFTCCKNSKVSANDKEKSGKPLVVIQLILLHTFHLPCPNYKRNGLYKDITGAQAHSLRSTLLEMMYKIIDGHDETGLGSKHIEFSYTRLINTKMKFPAT